MSEQDDRFRQPTEEEIEEMRASQEIAISKTMSGLADIPVDQIQCLMGAVVLKPQPGQDEFPTFCYCVGQPEQVRHMIIGLQKTLQRMNEPDEHPAGMVEDPNGDVIGRFDSMDDAMDVVAARTGAQFKPKGTIH